MRQLCITVLFPALMTVCGNALGQGTAVFPAPGGNHPAEQVEFNGGESRRAISELIRSGADLNAEDAAGNTLLLRLAAVMDSDARYEADADFRKELQATVIELLQNGADALKENNAGCNAVFYLYSDPTFTAKPEVQKLLPRELTLRIPHEENALLRYMQLRVAQAKCCRHSECLQYLRRRYCKPAYTRVQERVSGYLRAETAAGIPAGAFRDSLAFLRLADEEKADAFVENLPYWEHGEHFLEEIPERLLAALQELRWDVAPEKVEAALRKLETMLPTDEGDMIDCYAAYPMGVLLEMLARSDREKTSALLGRYSGSADPELAYTALKLLLQQAQLPLPEPGSLSEHLDLSAGVEALPEVQKTLLECAVADDAMRRGTPTNLTPELLERVQNVYRTEGLTEYADILSTLTDETGVITDKEMLQTACRAYREGETRPPRLSMARYILEHPELFASVPRKEP